MSSISPADGPISLGLGLLSIGRTWGHVSEPPPPEGAARELLEAAVDLGIRLFDTAPAYGTSERIFGTFLGSIGEHRRKLVVATKMGEHWDEAAGAPFTDHSYEALRRSLDRSLSLLQHIDILQIHKATSEVLRTDDVARTIEYARTLGIKRFGASVSDVHAADTARTQRVYSYLQFPFNRQATHLEPVLDVVRGGRMKAILNRPLAMGSLLRTGSADPRASVVDAFSFILERRFSGYVLMGTKSVDHLRANASAYRDALAARDGA